MSSTEFPLTFYTVQTPLVVSDILKHRLIHKDDEESVVAILIEQGSALEWLIVGFLHFHMDDHVAWLVLCCTCWKRDSPVRIIPCFAPGFRFLPASSMTSGNCFQVCHTALVSLPIGVPSGRQLSAMKVSQSNQSKPF